MLLQLGHLNPWDWLTIGNQKCLIILYCLSRSCWETLEQMIGSSVTSFAEKSIFCGQEYFIKVKAGHLNISEKLLKLHEIVGSSSFSSINCVWCLVLWHDTISLLLVICTQVAQSSLNRKALEERSNTYHLVGADSLPLRSPCYHACYCRCSHPPWWSPAGCWCWWWRGSPCRWRMCSGRGSQSQHSWMMASDLSAVEKDWRGKERQPQPRIPARPSKVINSIGLISHVSMYYVCKVQYIVAIRQ